MNVTMFIFDFFSPARRFHAWTFGKRNYACTNMFLSNNYTGTIFFNKNELRDHFLFLFLNE